jgi:hypothetical protein
MERISKFTSKENINFIPFYNWSIFSRQIIDSINMNKESTKRRQELQLWKQKKKVTRPII